MHELYKQRAHLVNQMKDLNKRAADENRDLTADEKSQWDKLDRDVVALTDRINRENALKGYEGFENPLDTQIKDVDEGALRGTDGGAERRDLKTGSRPEDKAAKLKQMKREGFTNYIRRGMRGLTSEQAEQVMSYEERGQVTGTDNLGGYLVPDEWSDELIMAMAYYGGMLEAPRFFNRSTGRDFHVPKTLFAGGGQAAIQKGAIVAEEAADAENAIYFGNTVISSYLYTSGLILASVEMLQDDDFNIEGVIRDTAADRVGRIINEHLTTGTGTGQPNGVVTAATLDQAAAANTALAFTDYINLMHNVDPAYRRGSKVGFMFNDSTLAAAKAVTLGAGDARPLWQMSVREGEPDKILGMPYWINQDMADIGSNAVPVIFGDFSKYWALRVRGAQLARSTERYFEKRQVGYFYYARFGGDLVDTHAISTLTCPV